MSRIHIALILDNRSWAPAYAAMRSVCLSSFRRGDLVFHLFHRRLGADQEYTLHRISAEFGAELALHPIDEDNLFLWLMEQVRAKNRPETIGYARLLFAEALPAEALRLVHLDSNCLVRAPIERLAELDLRGWAIAAVADPHGQERMTGRMMLDPRRIFDPAMRCFDGGLMLIDLERWRSLRLMEQFETMLDRGLLQEMRGDPDFFNLACRDNWLELDQFWNIVDPRPLHEALNPFAVHYAGPDKPWRLFSGSAYRRVYRHTMTNDVYYRFLAERLPRWLRPLVMWVKRSNG